MIRKHLLIALALVVASRVAYARGIKLEKEGLAAWVPDQWKVDRNDRGTEATSPGGEASVTFLSEPIRDLGLAYKNLPNVLGRAVPGIQLGEARETTAAGLPAIHVRGTVEVASEAGAMRLEVNVLILITPTSRALYVLTFVAAEQSSAFDAAIVKILGGLSKASADNGPRTPKDNPCWEFKGHPNGWRLHDWNGITYLVAPGWTASQSTNPDTDESMLQLSGDAGTLTIITHAAPNPMAAWQAIAQQAEAIGVGEVLRGEVAGQPALCARGQRSDAVVFHRGNRALLMLGQASGDPATMRGMLGSIRWK